MTSCIRLIFAAAIVVVLSSPAMATLKPGDRAPEFTAEASLGGKTFTFDLDEALKKGPVVLYFYPAAFTSACTIEAHDFAEAIDKFKAEGATVIGVSHDKIDTLSKFSVSDCRGKFAVAADTDGRIMRQYDAVMTSLLGVANRTSYVIAPDHSIVYAYTAMNPDQHVANTLQALHDWHGGSSALAGTGTRSR